MIDHLLAIVVGGAYLLVGTGWFLYLRRRDRRSAEPDPPERQIETDPLVVAAARAAMRTGRAVHMTQAEDGVVHIAYGNRPPPPMAPLPAARAILISLLVDLFWGCFPYLLAVLITFLFYLAVCDAAHR